MKLGVLLAGAALAVAPALTMAGQASAQTTSSQHTPAPRHDLGFTVGAHNAVNEDLELPALSIEQAFFRISVMEGNGRCMLAADCPLQAP